jgi:hypothetical protein
MLADLDPTVGDRHTLAPEEFGLLLLMPGSESPGFRHDPPPWETGRGADQVTDRTRRAREPGLIGDLTVGHDLAWFEAEDDRGDLVAEVLHRFLILTSW